MLPRSSQRVLMASSGAPSKSSTTRFIKRSKIAPEEYQSVKITENKSTIGSPMVYLRMFLFFIPHLPIRLTAQGLYRFQLRFPKHPSLLFFGGQRALCGVNRPSVPRFYAVLLLVSGYAV